MDIQSLKEFEAWWSENYDRDDFEDVVFSEILNEYESNYIVTDDLNKAWSAWQSAKAQAVPEKDAVIKKLSDQLYEQEMKTSAARVLCETACELLDDYAHQDAMVILNDLEQAMSTGASQ